MNKTPEKPQDNPEQSKRFEETARQLEADESGKAFKKALKIVVPPKPAATRSRPSGKRSSS